MKPPEFLGSTTVGERGQVVIPAEARAELDIKPGDKLLVMSGPGKQGLFIMKPEAVEKMVAHLTAQVEKLKGMKS